MWGWSSSHEAILMTAQEGKSSSGFSAVPMCRQGPVPSLRICVAGTRPDVGQGQYSGNGTSADPRKEV